MLFLTILMKHWTYIYIHTSLWIYKDYYFCWNWGFSLIWTKWKVVVFLCLADTQNPVESLWGRNVSRWEKGGVKENMGLSISESLVSSIVIKINTFLLGPQFTFLPFPLLPGWWISPHQVQERIWALCIALSPMLIQVTKAPGHQNCGIRAALWTAILSIRVLSSVQLHRT